MRKNRSRKVEAFSLYSDGVNHTFIPEKERNLLMKFLGSFFMIISHDDLQLFVKKISFSIRTKNV